MKPDMTVRIEALTELMPVAIVTGGGRELVISQVLDVRGSASCTFPTCM